MRENQKKTLLVVEDNPGVRKQLKWSLSDYEVVFAEDRASALQQFESLHPSVVTLDLGLPPDEANATEGLAALEEMVERNPHCKIIVVTGNDDRSNALKAISLGAYDFYEKPIDPDVLNLIIERAYKLFELEEENRELLAAKRGSQGSHGIHGASLQIQAACRMVEKVGPSLATTLIIGESGTGKELFARALHNLSARRDKPFVAVNCAAIPETLLESELFGYEKGAFTGAAKQTKGKIEYAQGGTFFLDEIGDMPLTLQAKMLRFLQERTVDRIGGREPIPVDVRIICATHQDLERLIEKGQFRQDLYYRVSEIVINIPALRDREGDKVYLAQLFLKKFSELNKKHFTGFSLTALKRIDTYAWPGNVRELENKIGRAVVLADGPRIEPEDLGFIEVELDEQARNWNLNLKQARESAELGVIKRALAVHNYNISHAAEALDVSRPQLYNLMKKLGLQNAGE